MSDPRLYNKTTAALIKPESVLTWARTLVANRRATDAQMPHSNLSLVIVLATNVYPKSLEAATSATNKLKSA